MKQDMIVILDLGSTENTKLARDIREMGVYSEIYPHDITASELKELPNVKGIIINGGPNNVVDGTPIQRTEYGKPCRHLLYRFFNRKFLWNFLIAPVRQVCGKRSEKDDGPGLYAAGH